MIIPKKIHQLYFFILMMLSPYLYSMHYSSSITQKVMPQEPKYVYVDPETNQVINERSKKRTRSNPAPVEALPSKKIYTPVKHDYNAVLFDLLKETYLLKVATDEQFAACIKFIDHLHKQS